MNSISQELLYEEVLANYIDDFFILTKTKRELKERTIQFLKIAEKHNHSFKQLNYDYDFEKIPILGVVIGRGKVQIENNKVKTIKNFSHTAKPLNELKEKKKWKWKDKYQKAFKELKDKITSQPLFALLKREGKFKVETDVSGHTIGEVLFQEQEGKQKSIVFLSRAMQPAKRNYEIYNKELLAIIEALTKWRQYLLDTTEKFEV